MEGEKAYPARMIDDYVKHIFTEHNQETDHLANLETEGRRKFTTEGVKNAEEWKAVRGCWDGSKKKVMAEAVGGDVIKAVDRENWMAISKIAVPLNVCTAMAAEIAGASMLTGALDLLLEKSPIWNISTAALTKF